MGTPGLYRNRVEVINRLCRLVPHFGIALLSYLPEKNCILATYPDELRERQVRRLAERDMRDWEYRIVITAVNRADVCYAIDTLCKLLNFDDARIATAAAARHWPEFEQIEPAIREEPRAGVDARGPHAHALSTATSDA